MTAPLVTYAVDGRVGIVSLDRPEKLHRHPLSPVMCVVMTSATAQS